MNSHNVTSTSWYTERNVVASWYTERERRELQALLEVWVAEVRALGAVEVGCKITLSEGGKWRLFVPIDAAAAFLTRQVMGQEYVEANGRDASGEFVGSCL